MLKAKVFYSFRWSFLSELAAKAITPLVYVILAKLLTPEDFGVVAVATIAISFSQVFWDAGFAKALIQRQSEIEESSHIVFWVNTVLGILIFILLYIFSPLVAELFGDHRVTSVLRVMGIAIIFSSFTSVHTALFKKDFHFKKLFWVRLITVALPGLASIPLAYFGYGYWALVIGRVIGQFFETVFLWIFSPWRPKLWFDIELLKELWNFGYWVMIGGLLTWFYSWMDSIIVGIYLSSAKLGLYNTGNTTVTMIYSLFFSPLLPVLYSAFSKLGNELETLRYKFEKVIKTISIVAFPIGFGFFAIQDHIELVVFGSQWEGLSLVIGVLGMSHAFAWIVGANGELYRAIGRPDLETKIQLYTSAFYLITYLVAIEYGLEIFIWTRFLLTVGAIGLHLYFAKHYLGINVTTWFQLSFTPLISSGIMLLILYFTNQYFAYTFLDLAILMMIGIVVYLIIIGIFEKKFIKNELLSLIKK